MNARGKPCLIRKHAQEGMFAERPPIPTAQVEATLDAPDQDDGRQAVRRFGGRTVIVYYEEGQDVLWVRSVSATRRRLHA